MAGPAGSSQHGLVRLRPLTTNSAEGATPDSGVIIVVWLEMASNIDAYRLPAYSQISKPVSYDYNTVASMR